MKSFLKVVLFFVSVNVLSSCASIFGGATYDANVVVDNDRDAAIYYKGAHEGDGDATFKIKRKHADEVEIVIKKDGCDDQAFNYNDRTFRGWSLVGSIVTWTGVGLGVPLPFGVALDGMNGAWWKPDTNEKGVSKDNYDRYIYKVNYTGCNDNE